MPQTIPLLAVPSQTLSTTLNGQAVGISLYTMNDAGTILSPSAAGFTADSTLVTADSTVYTADDTMSLSSLSLLPTEQLYIDVTLNGAPVITCKLVTVLQPLVITSAYSGFQGELEFFDVQNTGLQNSTNPSYAGLNTQYVLVYFSPADIAAGLAA